MGGGRGAGQRGGAEGKKGKKQVWRSLVGRGRRRAVGRGWSRQRTHFFLSRSGMSLFSALSTMTCGTREGTRAVRNGRSLGPGSQSAQVDRWSQTRAGNIQIRRTGILSGYLVRMRWASAWRLSAMGETNHGMLEDASIDGIVPERSSGAQTGGWIWGGRGRLDSPARRGRARPRAPRAR